MEIDLKKPGALNRQAVRQLIASVNDSTNVQLRVTLDGIAFISTTDVGNRNTEGLLFRLETWCKYRINKSREFFTAHCLKFLPDLIAIHRMIEET